MLPLTTEIGREARELGQLLPYNELKTRKQTIENQHCKPKSASGQQLWSNLETISGANQSLLNDRKAFNKAFGYDNKDVSEKALVDAFWKSKDSMLTVFTTHLLLVQLFQRNQRTLLHLLMLLSVTKTQLRFENLNPYQLSKVINSELIPWTQTYNDLMAKIHSLSLMQWN